MEPCFLGKEFHISEIGTQTASWTTVLLDVDRADYLNACELSVYRIFPAIRRGFRPSRMTSNNLISPMKFCYNTNSTLPKQCQSSRSILLDGSRTFGLFWKEETPSYNQRNTVLHKI